VGQTDGNAPPKDAGSLSNVPYGYPIWTSIDTTHIKFMNVAKRRYWKAACWETRTCSLGEGSRKSTTHQWQLVGFLSYITYIRLRGGFLYLVAIIDWFSRYVLAWQTSITLETAFCLEALDQAFQNAQPEIFNNDQGSQFTSNEFVNRLKAADVRISWDGRGRALDNIFVERLWRSVKYEEVYIKDYQTIGDAEKGLKEYFQFYNQERLHQSLEYQTPAQVYYRS
jgi:transposase InsO family protein